MHCFQGEQENMYIIFRSETAILNMFIEGKQVSM